MSDYYQHATPQDREPYDAMVRDALALPPGDDRRRELARLCRVGAYRPKKEDWPEFGEADWRDGVFYLRGKAQGLAVGDRVCADPENFAKLYEIVRLEGNHVEADDYEDTGKMVWKTKIYVQAVAINGSYDVIPGYGNEDIEHRIIWARSNAEMAIRTKY